MTSEIVSLENLDTTTLVFSEPEADFGGKDIFYKINIERKLDDDTTMPLYISGVDVKNTEEWCLAKFQPSRMRRRKRVILCK